jgi:hypothetical protein
MDAVREQASEGLLIQAENHVDALVSRVQPNRRSIEHRYAVFNYVQHLFTKCAGSRECTVSHAFLRFRHSLRGSRLAGPQLENPIFRRCPCSARCRCERICPMATST